MSILSSSNVGKNYILDFDFFDRLGLIDCGRSYFRSKENPAYEKMYNYPYDYSRPLYTLGAVFIYTNVENEFFYQSGNHKTVKILSRTNLLEMIKTDIEKEKQYLTERGQDLSEISTSYILDCYEKIYKRLKELI